VEWGFWEVVPDGKGWIIWKNKNTPWVHLQDYKSGTKTLKNIQGFSVKASDEKTWLKFKETTWILESKETNIRKY
jgi:hypothetical protein